MSDVFAGSVRDGLSGNVEEELALKVPPLTEPVRVYHAFHREARHDRTTDRPEVDELADPIEVSAVAFHRGIRESDVASAR